MAARLQLPRRPAEELLQPALAAAGRQQIHLAAEPARPRVGRQEIPPAPVETGALQRIDDHRARPHDDADHAFRQPSHGESRRHRIRRPHGDRQALRQAEEPGAGSAERAGGAFGRLHRRQQRRVELPDGAEGGIPAARQAIDAVAGRGGRVGHGAAGERMAETVLRRQDRAGGIPAGLPMETEHGRQVAPVDGHAGLAVQQRPAVPVEQARCPGVGPRVAPGDRGAERPVGAEHHQRRQLAGKADPGDPSRPAAAKPAAGRSHRGRGRLQPVARILLGLPRPLRGGGEGRLAGGEEPPLAVQHDGLDRGGAEVDAEAKGGGHPALRERAVSRAAARVSSTSASPWAKETKRFSKAPGWKSTPRSSIPSHHSRKRSWRAWRAASR